jgi:hypothetical protein
MNCGTVILIVIAAWAITAIALLRFFRGISRKNDRDYHDIDDDE